MCLAMPVLVVKLGDDDTALVDAGGVRKLISTALLDEVSEGDYIILHAGFALSRLDPEEAAHTLALFDAMAAAQ